jgi:IS4 transposase
MHTTLLNPPEWSQLEFGSAELGDARRSNRLVQIGAALATSPSGTLPQAFSDWPDLKAAYRFFSNPAIGYESIIAPHLKRTRLNCCDPGEFLLIEDTTELDYSLHRHCEGLGQIGNEYGRGLCLHTTLAVRVEAWDLEHCPEVTIVGVAGQKCWARPVAKGKKKKKENWRQRMERKRESDRWVQVLEQMPRRPEKTTWIYVADRESDVYEAFERCEESDIDFIIRAHYDRTLAEEDQGAIEAVGKAAVLGCFELEVRPRPERKARLAKLEVRAVEVTLKGVWRPGGNRPPQTMTVVQAREINGPEGEEPIHWVLFTSLPAERFVEARRIVARYAKRWVIEEFHKALKSGANVEKSELETARRLQALLGVLAVVAVRLVNTKMLARAYPEHPVDPEAFGPEALQVLSARFGEPSEGWRYGNLLVSIARMGGFLARRRDGDPGWITIWRGWQKLMHMSEGIVTLNNARTPKAKCG